MRFRNPFWASAFPLTLGSLLATASTSSADDPTIVQPDPQGVVEWVRTVYADAAWNGTPDIAHWRGDYYVVGPSSGGASDTEGSGRQPSVIYSPKPIPL